MLWAWAVKRFGPLSRSTPRELALYGVTVWMTMCAGCDCAPMPIVDAGALSDATQSDAPYACVPRDLCPPGCNWTPCGCVSDNPAMSCE